MNTRYNYASFNSLPGKEQELPIVNDFSSFTSLHECFDSDGSNNIKFKCTKFVFVEADTYTAWIGSLNKPKKQISIAQANNCLCRVPDDKIYPAVTPDLPLVTIADYSPKSDTWIKRPNISVYNQVEGSTIIADDFLEEVQVYQFLQSNSHPNLVEFKGCLEKNNRVVGILLKRYAATLQTRVEGYGQPHCNRLSFFEAIVAGVKHLHSLGLAHNDLNPRNIMLDEGDKPIIIDMGSCKRFGVELHEMGTPDWNDGFKGVSSIFNDEIGLKKIKKWLLEGGERRLEL
ncbi:kinase-like domain-containing protein [Xylogone sp. PMI_703]|nr:kinase-like domain-containing protein [Xylogone sp. PMI_703]